MMDVSPGTTNAYRRQWRSKGIYRHYADHRVSLIGRFDYDTDEAMLRYYDFGLAPRKTTTLYYVFQVLLKHWCIRNHQTFDGTWQIEVVTPYGQSVGGDMTAGHALEKFGRENLRRLAFYVYRKES